MKTAVVLFNLGGPESLKGVEPFLFNLFNDKAIINLPQPLRYVLAAFISARRTPIAKEIYQEMGGKSPILENTLQQAELLDKELNNTGEYKTFVCMRYSDPFPAETVADVVAYQPGRVVLLPLYPQFSTTTTGSAFAAWYKEAKKQK